MLYLQLKFLNLIIIMVDNYYLLTKYSKTLLFYIKIFITRIDLFFNHKIYKILYNKKEIC